MVQKSVMSKEIAVFIRLNAAAFIQYFSFSDAAFI